MTDEESPAAVAPNLAARHKAAAALETRWARQLSGAALRRVALADGEDQRVIEAALALTASGHVRPLLIGRRGRIEAIAEQSGMALTDAVEVRDPADEVDGPLILELKRALAEARRAVDDGEAARLAADPIVVGALLLRTGAVDACIAGATRSTSDVIRAGLRIVGLARGVSSVSSSFLMLLANGSPVAYGDCAVMPEPNAEDLAQIAIATAATFERLTGETARVAMLSFSTRGSADLPSAIRVRHAVDEVRRIAPGLAVDGELQFDAAVSTEVAAAKAPDSQIAGKANVFVFPNLDAGNIAYKITQYIGGAAAYGPVLQGLARPFNDLSRGASAADIAVLARISALQSLPQLDR